MEPETEGALQISADASPRPTAQPERDRRSALTFLLGTHQPNWLASSRVRLFISDRRLRDYRRLPRAIVSWALDSGAFTELATHGNWSHGSTPQQYVDRVRRYQGEVGRLLWAAPQDWMCEPQIVAKTGLTVAEHQRRTVANFCTLRQLAPELPFIPVVQGWTDADYLRCVALYRQAGVDLAMERLVGVGSVCRRQGSADVETILRALHAVGVTHLHGFGVKIQGLRRYGHLLTSADSLAWSFAARRSPRLRGCSGRHRTCANCPAFAYRWRKRLMCQVRHAGDPA
jgi:hypothetical protein